MAAYENDIRLVEKLKSFPTKSINIYSDLIALEGPFKLFTIAGSDLFLIKTEGFREICSISSFTFTEETGFLPKYNLTGWKIHVNIDTNPKKDFPEMYNAFTTVFAMVKKFSGLIGSVKITDMFDVLATYRGSKKALEEGLEMNMEALGKWQKRQIEQLRIVCEDTKRLLEGCQFTIYIRDNADAEAYALFFRQLQLALLSTGIKPAQTLPSGDEALSDYLSGRWDGAVDMNISAYIAAIDNSEYAKEKHSKSDLFNQIKEFPPLEQRGKDYLSKVETLCSRIGFWQQQTVTGLFGAPEIIKDLNVELARENVDTQQQLSTIHFLAQQKKPCPTRRAPTTQLIEAVKNSDESSIDELLHISAGF